jgi:uncharacterized membrane-anchored protein YhcB (DUF1043 family)
MPPTLDRTNINFDIHAVIDDYRRIYPHWANTERSHVIHENDLLTAEYNAESGQVVMTPVKSSLKSLVNLDDPTNHELEENLAAMDDMRQEIDVWFAAVKALKVERERFVPDYVTASETLRTGYRSAVGM